MTIGGSTDASTANRLVNISGDQPASFRYNNPGAQYPSVEAARFGQTGYGIIGGGHKIAAFPSPVNGAASNFDLLARKYVGMTIGAAGETWTGHNGFGVPGYDSNSMLTKEMLDDEVQAIAFLKAIAGRESGRGSNLTEQQWSQAHLMFKLGGADAYLKVDQGLGGEIIVTPPGAPPTKTGVGIIQRARAHVGEQYVNIQVPKDNPNWKGPWDCAEFASWLVYQEGGILYGCIDDNAKPSEADAYTGAWKADADRLGKHISVDQAAAIPGAFVLRYPPESGGMGHIAVCDGKGGTIEAKGTRYGVVANTVQGRNWDTGVLVPGINYDTLVEPIPVKPPEIIYGRGVSNMNPLIVKNIQQALGFTGANVDGDFGEDTERAVVGFQEQQGLTVDGEVGVETAGALGISLTDVSVHAPVQPTYPVPAPWQPPQQEPESEIEIGNPFGVFQSGMALMKEIKQVDFHALTIEDWLNGARVLLRFLKDPKATQSNGPIAVAAPDPMPMQQQGARVMVNWKTTLGGIGVIAAAVGTLATALSKGQFDASSIGLILTSLMGLFGGSGLLAAKDANVTGGTTSNSVRDASVERPTNKGG